MFRLASANTVPLQGCHSVGHRGRWPGGSAITLGAATIALLACANAVAQAPGNSSRMAQEQHACAVVMGLHQPGNLYDTCIRSLDKTLSELDRTRAASGIRSGCAEEGLKPGTPAFATCVVNAEESRPPAGYAAIDPAR